MREIAFDTETTGFDFDKGDRIVEIGCVELHNHIPTGRTLRKLINPERVMGEGAARVTGITDEMLADKPLFAEIANELIEFFGDGVIVAHNAKFDRGFLNMELARLGLDIVPEERWVDTVALAKARYPGAPASLDALCKRFNISLEARTLHGALLDAQLLADVYLELRGGRARAFSFDAAGDGDEGGCRKPARQRPAPLVRPLNDAEREAHRAFIETLGGENGPIWHRKAG
jgi:DNA polymerase III subunit epsilon